MRLTALVLVAMSMVLGAEERDSEVAIAAQLRGGVEVSTPAVSQARAMAVRMFASAGVRLEWCTRAKNCPDWEGSAIVTLEPKAPGGLSGAVLAGAQVFEGRNIRIYLDRLQAPAGRSRRPALLAHVLVHEITHLLQGCDRHAKGGVMKARWDDADFAAMESAPLAFTDDDIDLIRAGLARRKNAFGPAALTAKR